LGEERRERGKKEESLELEGKREAGFLAGQNSGRESNNSLARSINEWIG
jgi:hypothetical protein